MWLYQSLAPNHPISPYFQTVKMVKTAQQVCRAVGLNRMTPSGSRSMPSALEPANIKWIPLTPGRAVQYNGGLEIARKWSQG